MNLRGEMSFWSTMVDAGDVGAAEGGDEDAEGESASLSPSPAPSSLCTSSLCCCFCLLDLRQKHHQHGDCCPLGKTSNIDAIIQVLTKVCSRICYLMSHK